MKPVELHQHADLFFFLIKTYVGLSLGNNKKVEVDFISFFFILKQQETSCCGQNKRASSMIQGFSPQGREGEREREGGGKPEEMECLERDRGRQ